MKEKIIKIVLRIVLVVLSTFIVRVSAEFITWGDFTYAALENDARLGLLFLNVLFMFITWRFTFKDNFPLESNRWFQELTNLFLNSHSKRY